LGGGGTSIPYTYVEIKEVEYIDEIPL